MLSEQRIRAMQDSTWADGLRGVAALYVASSHLTLCFGRAYVTPCCRDDATRTPWLFQRPILRLIACGHSWVSIFFVLLGFVNALKPIKQARSGNIEAALSGLATASFRRSFRLVLPAAVATTISWFLTQLGICERSRNSDAFWLYLNTPLPSVSWGQAIEDLVKAILDTWRLRGVNPYDQPQWALFYLLEGSIIAFFVMIATVQLKPFWRQFTLLMCTLWSFSWSYQLWDPLAGFNVISGIMLAEFSLSSYPMALASIPLVTNVMVPVLVVIALVLMSFPSSNYEAVPWSANIGYFFTNAFPVSAQLELHRLVGSVGAVLLAIAVLNSPHLRTVLALRPLRWLGKVSFPIYLLHGTFMRSMLAWLVFAGQPLREFPLEGEGVEEGATVARYVQPGALRILISIVISAAALFYASDAWANHLEPVFGRLTAWCEAKMKNADNGAILASRSTEKQQQQQNKLG